MQSLNPLDKYKFKPFYGSSHFWVLGQLQKLAKTARILDIGAGSGAIGHTLRENGFQNLSAVEPDATARTHCANIYQRAYADLNDSPPGQADVILLMDVIEHLANSDDFLKQSLLRLAPGGIAYVSVPNVAHWSVRLPLLFGSFRYTSRGILDRTHLTFFTRSSFENILKQQVGYRIESMHSSIEPAEFVLPASITQSKFYNTLSKIRVKVAELLPGLMAYQHLAILRKL